jgi:hypothetical protein
MTPRLFRVMLVLVLTLALAATCLELAFPELVPSVAREAQKGAWADKSLAYTIVFGLAAIAIYVIGVASLIGLYFFRNWARILALIATVTGSLYVPSMGFVATSGWAYALSTLSETLWGAVLALAYFSPLKERFKERIEPGEAEPASVEPEIAADLPLRSLAGRKRNFLISNLRPALRGFFFLRVNAKDIDATWSQFIFLTALGVLIQFVSDFAHVGYPGQVSQFGWAGALFGVPVVLFAAWGLADLSDRTDQTLVLAVLFSAIAVPVSVIGHLMGVSLVTRLIWAFFPDWARLGHYVPAAWFALASGVATIRLVGTTVRQRTFAFLLAIIALGLPLGLVYRDATLWMAPYDPENSVAQWRQRQVLDTEDIFYLQPKLLAAELASLKPGDKGRITLFFVGVAGYADQDVFMKEVRYVSSLFKERYGTQDHSVTLINNVKSAGESPIASSTSLQLTLNRIGELIDKDKDILFLYLTSHGSKDHKFSLDMGSMQFHDLDPPRLRKSLDESGIKRRVIVVSACYSGGFVDPLKSEDTLIMTASAADKQSFGCSNEADFTYFGQAYFRDALNKTRSFIEAFDLAKPAIAAREAETNFEHADPQIFIGANMRAALDQFDRQAASPRAAASAGGSAATHHATKGASVDSLQQGEGNERSQ